VPVERADRRSAADSGTRHSFACLVPERPTRTPHPPARLPGTDPFALRSRVCGGGIREVSRVQNFRTPPTPGGAGPSNPHLWCLRRPMTAGYLQFERDWYRS
jgi:hypothetical protein